MSISTTSTLRAFFVAIVISSFAHAYTPLQRVKRAAVSRNAILWPDNVIPYIIDKAYFSEFYLLQFCLMIGDLLYKLGDICLMNPSK